MVAILQNTFSNAFSRTKKCVFWLKIRWICWCSERNWWKKQNILVVGSGNTYHYCDVVMGAMASQITSLTVVYSTIYLGPDQWKHQSSASLTYVWGIHRWPVNSPHRGPITRKMFPFDDVIMLSHRSVLILWKALSKHRGLLLKIQLFGELTASVTDVCVYDETNLPSTYVIT